MLSIINRDGEFYLLDEGEPLLTPKGTPVSTTSQILAHRMLEDIRRHGIDESCPSCVVGYQFAYLDHFATVPREEILAPMLKSVPSVDTARPRGTWAGEKDWTLHCPMAADRFQDWMRTFLALDREHIASIGAWLRSLSRVWLCAVSVLAKAMRSYNIPFLLATKVPAPRLRPWAGAVHRHCTFMDETEILERFRIFRFFAQTPQRFV
ncbi:MAG: hypothetical protein LBR22_02105 [Desulfovibrio sp.]|jgi:hypothetical protein|nr:hypothetical protein [Desulfovibrio sp.]